MRAGGGDGYEMLADLPRVLGFGPSLDQALADFTTFNTPPGGSVRNSPCLNLVRSALELWHANLCPINREDRGHCAP